MATQQGDQPLTNTLLPKQSVFDSSGNETMRIGEIAIVGPGRTSKMAFIKAACEDILVDTPDLIYGRLQINEQLALHLYGLDGPEQEANPFWDLVSPKLLGYIVLFDWNDPDGFGSVKQTIDSITEHYRIPVVIVANVAHLPAAIPADFINTDLNLAEQSQLTFCNISQPASVRNVLVTLIDSLIEKLNS